MPESGSTRVAPVWPRAATPETASPEVSPRDVFPPTDWSLVINAGGTSRDALERLCRLYWSAIYRYLRAQRCSREDALDLTQSFFEHLVARRDLGQQTEPGGLEQHRSQFRAWLITSLRAFLSNARSQRTRRTRSIRAEWLSSDEAAVLDAQSTEGGLDPEQAFEQAWALGILKRALLHLELDFAAHNRKELFRELQPYLVTAHAPGDLRRIAQALGLTDSTLRVTLFRMRRRLAELVRLEISNALPNRDDQGAIDQELSALMSALAR